ncbi:MAG: hypothetical protein E7655_03400 [Ruminococcaceae bacterium]|nr:hypothetical protein [Oscillospiraceae bacterium]
MKRVITVLSAITILLLLGMTAIFMTSCSEEISLSSSCDKILCTGTDEDGNYYELVGNQYEDALGVEIELGIIKNNTWLVELTDSFPFLNDNGMFRTTHYTIGGIIDEDLYSYPVSSNIQFITSGAFVIEKYIEASSFWAEDEKVLCFFSCKTLKSTELSLNEYNIPIKPYDGYCTEDDDLLLYGISGEKRDEWLLFNVNTFEMKSMGKHKKGAYPIRPVSEGLIFASDECFYNTNFEKVIDISEYNIDLSAKSTLCFEEETGNCCFYVTNPQGKRYFIVIDKTGKIVSQRQESD